MELNYVGHIQVQHFFLILKIEPFNYAIKSVCFDFCSTNLESSVIKTSTSEGSLLPNFYRFRCHYPLIPYLRPEIICWKPLIWLWQLKVENHRREQRKIILLRILKTLQTKFQIQSKEKKRRGIYQKTLKKNNLSFLPKK